jgi:DNA-binding response OmpR family regulator
MLRASTMGCARMAHVFYAAVSRLRGLRVLMVEDSWNIANALRLLLEDAGMVITGAAATTADAERLMSLGAPAVALVDVKLRDGMALGLIDRFHDLGIGLVVVSGFSTFPAPLRKAATILQKPFNGEELFAAMCSALRASLQ